MLVGVRVRVRVHAEDVCALFELVLFLSSADKTTPRSVHFLRIMGAKTLKQQSIRPRVKNTQRWRSRPRFASRKTLATEQQCRSHSCPTTPRISWCTGSAQDVKKIAQLLHSGAPQDELERAVVNGVNRRFYGADVPADVVDVRT